MWDEAYGSQRWAKGTGGVNCLHCAMTIYTDPLYLSNPLVSSEPQVCPNCIVGVFEYESVDLNILWGLVQLSSVPNAMIRDFWQGR